MKKRIKLCRECKWCENPDNFWGGVCQKNRTYSFDDACTFARLKDGKCGQPAKYFEPIED